MIAEKLLSLLISAQNAFLTGDILSLKNRFLFALLKKPCAPQELMDTLRQDKSNIAHLAAGLELEGLIEKSVFIADRRRVRYALSESGRNFIVSALSDAEDRFTNFLDAPDAKADAEEKIDEVLRLLSFL